MIKRKNIFGHKPLEETVQEKVERIKQQEFDKLSDGEKQEISDEEKRIYDVLDKFFKEHDASN